MFNLSYLKTVIVSGRIITSVIKIHWAVPKDLAMNNFVLVLPYEEFVTSAKMCNYKIAYNITMVMKLELSHVLTYWMFRFSHFIIMSFYVADPTIIKPS